MSTPHDSSRRTASTADADSLRDVPAATTSQTGPDPELTRRSETARDDAPAAADRGQRPQDTRPVPAAKTSAAAVFSLVFGLAALFCALTAILSPAAVLFGLIGLVLAVVGLKMAKRPGITGKGVAVGGLVTSLLGLVLGVVVIGGLAAVVNDTSQLDRIQRYVDDARANLPSTDEVRDNLPSN